MFKNEELKEANVKEAETIIGQSVKVKGNFQGQGNIIIEGELEGSVKTDNFLFIGEKAKIIASVSAKNANIGGKINGNINVEGFLEIKASAKINGDIKASKISIEKGATFNGNCVMNKEQTQVK